MQENRSTLYIGPTANANANSDHQMDWAHLKTQIEARRMLNKTTSRRKRLQTVSDIMSKDYENRKTEGASSW